MRRPTNHSFARVPRANIQRSSFDRSHGHKTSFDAGLLIPIYVDEALPGDTFNLSMTGFARLSTPLKPIMDNMYINTFFFFVPNRLLWSNWVRFMGEEWQPGDSTDYLVPRITSPAGGWTTGSLGDYFGLPLGQDVTVNSLHFRAYNLVWNEWFRDENLQTRLPQAVGDGPDAGTSYTVRRRGKRHDYFTSCLPWPQKGESVSIPLGSAAPVLPTDPFNPIGTPTFGTQSQTLGTLMASTGVPTVTTQNQATNAGGLYWVDPQLHADLSNATAATINQLRQAFQIQRLYERDARGGTRYTEIVRSHFGVVSPDARLQRPEYLGGGQSFVNFAPVAQTQRSDVDESPQGNLAAFATSAMHGHGFSKSFTEHGVILGLLCVRADLNYQQGINRMWDRQTRFDFYWPVLGHIGEQSVLQREIYTDGTPADQDVFGYQERYAEYRYKPSAITGKLRSSDPQSLDVWHLAQDFATRPLLNDLFIQETPPMDRIVAVPSEPDFIGDFWFRLRCARPMAMYGVPGMMDHF